MTELDKEDLGLLVELCEFVDLAQRPYRPANFDAWEALLAADLVQQLVDSAAILPTTEGHERARRIKKHGKKA